MMDDISSMLFQQSSFSHSVMIAVMLGGMYLRGDFPKETFEYAAIESSLEGIAIEKYGRALININRADASALIRIEGIGQTLAERIVAYREEYGAFESLDELLKVDGIGTKKLEKMKERLFCTP